MMSELAVLDGLSGMLSRCCSILMRRNRRLMFVDLLLGSLLMACDSVAVVVVG